MPPGRARGPPTRSAALPIIRKAAAGGALQLAAAPKPAAVAVPHAAAAYAAKPAAADAAKPAAAAETAVRQASRDVVGVHIDAHDIYVGVACRGARGEWMGGGRRGAPVQARRSEAAPAAAPCAPKPMPMWWWCA